MFSRSSIFLFLGSKRNNESVGPNSLEQGVTVSNQQRAALLILACVTMLPGWPVTHAQGQRSSSRPATSAQTEANSRNFWPPGFRPPSATPNAQPASGTYLPATSKRSKRRTGALKFTDPAVFGITLWLLRPAQELQQPTKPPKSPNQKPSQSGVAADNEGTPRLLVKRQKAGKEVTESMIAQRVNPDRPFQVGEDLRLSVEIPQDGYLYVIDREQYAGSKLSVPVLIFPSDPLSDENKVRAGRVIELPDNETSFQIKRLSEQSHQPLTGELLTFLVTRTPLTNLPKSDAEGLIRLDEQTVKQWEEQWGKQVQIERLNLKNGAGQNRTKAEQQALTEANQALTQEAPLPQTIFRLSVKQGNPFLVQLSLRVGK